MIKYDLNAIRSDVDNFMVHEHMIGSTPVYLIQPVHIGARWDRTNLINRSAVVTADGTPVSLSWKKFANFGEKPEVFNVPSSLDGCEAMEKIDGSTLPVSTFMEPDGTRHLVIRTRGTVDATKQDNGWEIELLKQKYPMAFNNAVVTSGIATVVFEWYSPSNKIVLDYGDEPLLYLTGIINHRDYSYVSQDVLDIYAKEWGVLRPRRYKFETLDQLQTAVKAFRGVEGVCLYFHGGQEITKIKGDSYLFLHRAKSDISSLEKVIDLYLDRWTIDGHFYSYDEFFAYLEKTFDYEIAVMARGHVSRICDAMKEVEKIIHAMRNFLTPFMVSDKPRKDVALAIQQAYGTTGRAGLAFKTYDRKPLVPDDIKRLLFQVLKS